MLHLPSSIRALWPALALLLLPISTVISATPDVRCFELRIYTASPGKLDELHARFRNHTLALFTRHGMTNIGYWVPAENLEGKLVYLLAYPSKEAREESWKKFQADPEWVQAKAASEVNGKLVAAVEQRFWQAADFSPVVAPGIGAKRTFELRTYLPTSGNFEALVRRAGLHSDWLFKTYGIEFLGAFTPLAGQEKAESNLTYLLAHPSVEAGEASFKKLRADPQWMAIKEESEKAAGGSLTVVPDGIVSMPLVATDYSPMK